MARNSTTDAAAPAKPRWYKQIAQVYRISARVYPLTWLWLLLSFVVVTGGVFAVSFLLGGGGLVSLLVSILLALSLGVMAPLIILARLTDRAMFKTMENQQGATAWVFQLIRRGWWLEQEPAAVDPRTKDLVFRAVGKPGLVLITEGPLPRVLRLAESEKKRHGRVLKDVPIHVLHVGSGEDQIPLRDLRRRMNRLPRKLTSSEVSAVGKRLAALGATRPPVPKGIDPYRARPDRRAVRGR